MTQTADQKLNQIAQTTLGLETLETRKSDGLDFHELSVWQIKKALAEAYMAGFAAGAASEKYSGTEKASAHGAAWWQKDAAIPDFKIEDTE